MNAPDDTTTTSAWTMSYVGERVANSTMDVSELADALHSVHRLFLRSNRIVNGNAAVASLRIRATTPGSFDVQLLLHLAVALGTNVLSSDFITTADSLRKLLTGDGNIMGVLETFRRLGGRSYEVMDRNPDAVTIQATNVRINIPNRVFEIYKDTTIQRALNGVVAPLRTPGMDRVVVRDDNGELISLDSSEIESTAGMDSQATTDNVIEIPRQDLAIVAPNLDDPHAKWRLSSGQSTNWYSILDERFLERVTQGDERFGTGDILVCGVRINQSISNDNRISSEYLVTRVIEHRLGGSQPFLL